MALPQAKKVCTNKRSSLFSGVSETKEKKFFFKDFHHVAAVIIDEILHRWHLAKQHKTIRLEFTKLFCHDKFWKDLKSYLHISKIDANIIIIISKVALLAFASLDTFVSICLYVIHGSQCIYCHCCHIVTVTRISANKIHLKC